MLPQAGLEAAKQGLGIAPGRAHKRRQVPVCARCCGPVSLMGHEGMEGSATKVRSIRGLLATLQATLAQLEALLNESPKGLGPGEDGAPSTGPS